MRFMMLLKGNPLSESGAMPDEELVNAMGRYNEEMVNAGVLLAAEGLHPTSTGAKIIFTDGKPKLIDGPFAEAKEVIAGFWMIQVRSKEEAIEWALRCPDPFGTGTGEIELRQVFETEDFPQEYEAVQKETALRERMEGLKKA